MIRFLQNLFFHDFWLKLVSLALAILVYVVMFYIVQKDSPAGTGSLKISSFDHVAVEVVSSSGDVSRFTTEPETVDLQVEGGSKLIKLLRRQDVHAMVDLSKWDGRSATEQAVRVTTPAGVSLVNVKPDRVKIIPPAPEQ